MSVQFIHQYLADRGRHVEELRGIDLFEGVDDEAARARAAAAQERSFTPGEYVLRAGDGADAFKLLLEGGSTAPSSSTGASERDHPHTPRPGLAGSLALPATRRPSRCAPSSRRGLPHRRARVRRLLFARPLAFDRVTASSGRWSRASRARSCSARSWPRSGTMSAGLAHELNNPAAAARRTAGALGEALDPLERHRGRVRGLGDRARPGRALARSSGGDGAGRGEPDAVDSLAVADAEDAMRGRARAPGVAEPGGSRSRSPRRGLDAEWLAEVAEPRDPRCRPRSAGSPRA